MFRFAIGSDKHDVCFYSINVSSDAPRFPREAALWHTKYSKQQEACRQYLHILLGWKDGRIHNEVWHFMATAIKALSKSRNPKCRKPLSRTSVRYQSSSESLTRCAGVALASHWKHFCSSCQICVKTYNAQSKAASDSRPNKFVNHTISICSARWRTIELLWHVWRALIKIPTNQFIHLSIMWLRKPFMSP